MCDVYPNDGEILGHVTPIDNDLEFNKFYDILEKSWLTYVKEVYINDFEDIESFVEWYNTTFPPFYGIITEVEIYNI